MGYSFFFAGSSVDLVFRLGWDASFLIFRLYGFHLEMFSHEAYLRYQAEDYQYFTNLLFNDGLENFGPQEPEPEPEEEYPPNNRGNNNNNRGHNRANRRYRPG